MTETMTDADRIAAEGVTIPTTKGQLRLLYGMRALRSMEAKYGSVVGMQEQMQELLDTFTEGDGKAAAFGPLCDIITPGLLHLGYTEDAAVDLLMPRHTKVYAEAMAAAMREAFPDADDDAGSTGNGEAQAPAAGSPGPSGTTSQPAATAAQTPSSG